MTKGIYKLELEISVPDLDDVGAMDAVDAEIHGALHELRLNGDINKAVVKYDGEAVLYEPHGQYPGTPAPDWEKL